MTPGRDKQADPARQRRRRRRLFAAIALLFVYVLIELGGAVAWWASTGRFFTWARASEARAVAQSGDDGLAVGAGADVVQRAARHKVTQHPYLGFVHPQPKKTQPELPISTFGFHGDSPIRKKGDDKFIVGVFGGSVALTFGLYAEDALRTALQRSAKLEGRSIELVKVALGGYKQPQQLLALQLLLVLGGEFDCVVNLDGFNEIALLNENVPLGVPAWFPRSWARLLDSSPSPEQLQRIGRISYLRTERQQRAEAAGTFWWSPLMQFLWQRSDRATVTEIAQLQQTTERAKPTDNPAIVGPGTGGRTIRESRQDMVALWQRASLQMQATCDKHGIRYFHFLQPNQYVPDSKPIGAAERAIAIHADEHWQDAVLEGYPLLRAAGQELKAQGVRYRDLTNIFQKTAEPIYTDSCCHFGATGNAIMAEHIAAAIRESIDLEGVEIASLRIEPETIEITSPLQRHAVKVVGIDGTGNEHDLSGSGFGTRMTATPSDHVQIDADGSVRAKRRGTATVRVAKDATTATVQLRAAWPDVFRGDDEIAAPSGIAPAIRIDPDELRAGAKKLTVQCSGMPEAPVLLLATSHKPLPKSPTGAETLGVLLTPITTTNDTANVKIAYAAKPGVPTFVRLYALNQNLSKIIAASATTVITRD